MEGSVLLLHAPTDRLCLVRRLVLPLVLIVGLAVPVAPALATGECDGAPSACVSVNSGEVPLGHLGTRTRRLNCPSSNPYYWGFDWITSSSAVSVTWMAQDVTLPGWASFTATNWSVTHDNQVEFYLGCVVNPPGSARHPADRPGSPLHNPSREQHE
jgi:hypothetical protein